MIALLIKFVTLFRWLYEWMGVNFNQLKTIVATKMLIDNRRSSITFNQQKAKESSNTFLFGLLIYSFFGLFFAYLIYAMPSFIIGMTIYHSYVIVMVSLTLVSDFSAVLLDTSDNTIILPRPVSSSTLLAARITHIILYIGQIVAALSLGSIVATFMKFGMGMGLLLMLTTILSVFFAVILTNGLYLLLMHFTSEEKLKTIINYFQIAMAMIMMGAYQILPRMMTNNLMAETDFALPWWSVFVPPLWMAGLLDIVYSHSLDLLHVTCGLFAFAFSIGAFFLVSKYFSSSFAEKLADLGTSSVVVDAKAIARQNKSKSWFSFRDFITNPGLERASYGLVTAALARDRKLKLKVYPSIGYVVILALLLVFRQKDSFETTLANLHNRSVHILIIYFVFLIIQMVMSQIAMTDEFKAGWVYSASPINKPGHILLGMWKAILTRFFVPIYFVYCVLVISIWKLNGVDDLIFGFVSNVFLSLIAAVVSTKHFPLSMESNTRNQAGNLAKVMLVMILVGAVGFGHYLLSKITYGLLIGFPFLLALTTLAYYKYKNTKWSQMDY